MIDTETIETLTLEGRPPESAFLSQEKPSVEEIIVSKAEEYGVPVDLALFIAKEESQFNPSAVGDTHLICEATGKPIRSRGIWQINSCAHPDVSDELAFNVASSTDWAMPLLKKTPEIWSTYKLWR